MAEGANAVHEGTECAALVVGDAAGLAEALLAGRPGIAVCRDADAITINPVTLRSDHDLGGLTRVTMDVDSPGRPSALS